MSTDILRALLESSERTPEAPAMSLGKVTLSYGELRDRILGLSSALAAIGLEPGDRVLFSVRPGLDGISLALGIIAAGATVVFADPGAGEELFRSRATLAAPKWVAAESLLYAASSGVLRPLARRRGIELPHYASVVPDARHIVAGRWLPGIPSGAITLSSLLKGISGAAPQPQTAAAHALAGDPAAEALIIFTSGTTAKPKAVVHSRNTLGTGLSDFAAHVGFVSGERVLTDQLMVGIPALISGAHWMLPPAGLDPGASPAKYLDLLPGADVLFAVPAALDALLELLEREPAKTPRLRALLIGGAPVLRPLLERARTQLPGTSIRAIYGMTEILPVAIADGDDKLAFVGTGDYVGEVMSHVTATIVEGELVLAGAGLALGYLGDEPLAELRTGDLARFDGDRLVLSGRSKDMFIRGTTNVYPGLYEPVIAGLPGVSEAALVGIANSMGDDRIVLVLVPTTVSAGGLSAGHPVIETVRAALPGLIDSAVLPDVILATDRLPRSGRSLKLDRAELAALVRKHLP